MDTVVINLASQPDRWQRMRAQFAAAGVPVRRVPAVDGGALTGAERAALYDPALNRRQHHKPLRPGEIGCYASHLQAWRQLLASHERAMAVFEDDVEIDPAVGRTLEALQRLPAGWDLIKLYGRPRERIAARRGLLAGVDLIDYRKLPSHTCAYAISRRGAERLLAARLPFGRPVDVDLRHWWEVGDGGLAVQGVWPYPVRLAQGSRSSAIDDGRRGCTGPAMRLRKISLQLRYALLNAWHAGRPLPAAPRPGPAGGETPAPHDAA